MLAASASASGPNSASDEKSFDGARAAAVAADDDVAVDEEEEDTAAATARPKRETPAFSVTYVAELSLFGPTSAALPSATHAAAGRASEEPASWIAVATRGSSGHESSSRSANLDGAATMRTPAAASRTAAEG